jgi:hypothetical protein
MNERLHEVIWWYPFPLVISFALVMILTAHVMFGTNPRAGNPANIIAFPSDTQKDSALWLSVTPVGKEIVVTTSDRRVFRWPQDVRGMQPLAPLVAYLKERAQEEIRSAVIAGRVLKTQTQAVIAADQRLKYLHIRPIIHALAAAGISQYAFETQNPAVAVSHGGPHGG